MADIVDRADEQEELIKEASVAHITAAAAKIPLGKPGDCFYCGEESQRVVGEPQACARCRDKRHLP